VAKERSTKERSTSTSSISSGYDPPTTSVDVGTVVLVAFIMLVIGFVSGYLVRLLRSKKGVPILDEDPDEENFERASLSSDA
jgi:hypothetical protein